MNNVAIVEAIENDNRWDAGELGQDENAVRAVNLTPEQQQAIDDALDLRIISIRLPNSLVEDFKFLGDFHGIHYQTLIRQTLARFASAEMKNMARKAADAQIKATRQEASESTAPNGHGKRHKAA
ncbi:hypothetical protein [Methylomagnum sp.]